jgi:hypothetical protein
MNVITDDRLRFTDAPLFGNARAAADRSIRREAGSRASEG